MGYFADLSDKPGNELLDNLVYFARRTKNRTPSYHIDVMKMSEIYAELKRRITHAEPDLVSPQHDSDKDSKGRQAG